MLNLVYYSKTKNRPRERIPRREWERNKIVEKIRTKCCRDNERQLDDRFTGRRRIIKKENLEFILEIGGSSPFRVGEPPQQTDTIGRQEVS